MTPPWIVAAGVTRADLTPDEREYAVHAAARCTARMVIEPVAAARTPEQVHDALHGPWAYTPAVQALCAWIEATPRALESMLERVPEGARTLDYTTLDVYLVPRVLGALAVLCAHASLGAAADRGAMQYSGALLAAIRDASGATMRLAGTVLHLCLASAHQSGHARFLLHSALAAAGTRGPALPLCGSDAVPEPYALAVAPTAPAPRAPGTSAYVWTRADSAAYELRVGGALGAAATSCLGLLVTRMAAELGSVFPAAMHDLVDRGMRALLTQWEAELVRSAASPQSVAVLRYDALVAAAPLVATSPALYHVVRLAAVALAAQIQTADAACERYADALEAIYAAVRASSCSRMALAVQLGDAALLGAQLAAEAARADGAVRRSCAALLCIVLHGAAAAPAYLDAAAALLDVELPPQVHAALAANVARWHAPALASPSLDVPRASLEPRSESWEAVALRACRGDPRDASPCGVCDAPVLDVHAAPRREGDELVAAVAYAAGVPLSDVSRTLALLQLLVRLVVHAPDDALAACDVSALERMLHSAASHVHRGVRLRAGRLLYVAVARYAALPRDVRPAAWDEVLVSLVRVATSKLGGDARVAETSVVTVALLGRVAQEATFVVVADALVRALYLPHAFVRALVYTETIQLAAARRCTTFQLFAVHLDVVCGAALAALPAAPRALVELARLLNMSEPTFLQTALPHTLPRLLEQLVMGSRRNEARAMIESMAATLDGSVPALCVAQASDIFKYFFLRPAPVRDAALQALLELLGTRSVTIASLLRSRLQDVLGFLLTHLGGGSEVRQRALAGLEFVHATVAASAGKWRGMDLETLLQEEVLAVLTWINEELGGVHGKRSVRRRAMAVRAVGELLVRIGAVAARVAPQVLACLSSALAEPALTLPTLASWLDFVRVLRYSDVGPLTGSTAAALLAAWPRLDRAERGVAAAILRYLIVESGDELEGYLDDVPSLDALADALPDVAQRLRATRRVWDDEAHLERVLERVASDSAAVCEQALAELRAFLHERRGVLAAWTTGSAFHPLVSRCVHALLAAARTSADAAGGLCLECLGLLGAVDPDRLALPGDEPLFVLLSDFDSAEETLSFALRLLVDVAVPAFRATHDTKHQAALAYAIQELLKFCEFTPALLDHGRGAPERVRRRWDALPESLVPTLAPLLTSRYVVQAPPPRERPAPLFAHVASFREWLSAWTLHLMAGVRAGDAATLFHVFASAVRDQDVGIARYLVPHLVLHTVVSGTNAQRRGVLAEMNAVLADVGRPAPRLPDDARLAAQVLFRVLDHVGHWMRRMRLVPLRAKRSRLRDALADVHALMDSISQETLARASLQCHAYTRALLAFEYRVRDATCDDEALQPDLETMHEIYASLDDPDGMEGISTRVLAPSLEHQIREHESTGRWTDAQSCWEVELQQRPDDVRPHVGLLRCLRSLGHYDTLRTHVRGVLSVHPEWQPQLASLETESACVLADWAAVRALVSQAHSVPELAMARALLAMREGDAGAVDAALRDARRQLGAPLLGPGHVAYAHAYDAVTHLHMLCELELVFRGQATDDVLRARLAATLPSFRTREPVLSVRRSAMLACSAASDVSAALGASWMASAKVARQAGHTQSAYSAVLQAQQHGAPFAFVQQAKLLALADQRQGALQTLNHALRTAPPADRHALARAHLLRARLVEETARFQQNEIIQHYKTCTELDPDSEKIWYHLGRFYDAPGGGAVGNQMLLQLSVCRFYMKSAQHGTKYLYRTLPRMLTIWLDAGTALAEPEPDAETARQFDKINAMMRRSAGSLARYQWFAVFPQLVARIVHKNESVWQVLLEIIVAVVRDYPQQGMWALLAGSHSKDKRRKQRYDRIVARLTAERERREVPRVVEAAERLSTALLALCEYPVGRESSLSMQRHFPALCAAVQSGAALILPLQSSVNVTLPPDHGVRATHRPFPTHLPTITGFDDTVEIMHSLQKPRKIIVHASNGARYPFLCKPRDDLRKDARLMEFDAMINKLLQSNSESRRRRLYIRTYAVVILNEECGLIEWVPNTVAFRHILAKHYAALDIPMYTSDLKTILDAARAAPKNAGAIFTDRVLARYPPVFHAWFLETFPEPSAWFRARSAYARTAAVMSMVGFVLGLGDRHCDNILFDAGSGDTVHVDLNCLFEKGTSFEIPERVPFRLTHNMVDALGVTGVEGAFRRTAEIALGILRDNKDSLMSVLQAMVHDPLGEWVATERRARAKHGDAGAPAQGASAGARKALKGVSDKLDGKLRRPGLSDEVRHTTKNLVHMLICDATSPQNLGQMYIGWAPYL